MQRVAVVGPGGAGKSTFARGLGERTGLPVIHLDRHFWKPGWEPSPTDEWISTQRCLVSADRWIADGNYGGTFDIRFRRADTVIVLAPPRRSCVAGVVRRWATNRGRPVQAPDCRERLTGEFLRWVWRWHEDSRPRLDRALDRHPHLDVIELTSHRRANGFLQELATTSRPPKAR